MSSSSRVFIGFDGFIDTLLHCVAKRTSPHRFTRLSTIPLFSKKVLEAASQSANIECVIKEQALGGNAPLLAYALATLGSPGTLVGTCGYPTIHPLFEPLSALGISLFSFAEPGRTDALEFTDGKLLLGKMGELSELSIKTLTKRLSKNFIHSHVQKAEMLVTANWTMMPLVGEFWEYLLSFPSLLKKGPHKSLFVDLADPAKRPAEDLKKGLLDLSLLNNLCNVILGLNRSESCQVLHALGAPSSSSLETNAKRIASTLHLSSVVLHTHQEVAVASYSQGTLSSASLRVPVFKNPKRSTGAGDTFNAGFIAGVLQHEPPLRCLEMAVAASGIFVRTGVSPTPKTMKSFLQKWKEHRL